MSKATMPECEAEERIKMALYEMELAWGAGQFDYTKIRRILTGTEKCQEGTHWAKKAA